MTTNAQRKPQAAPTPGAETGLHLDPPGRVRSEDGCRPGYATASLVVRAPASTLYDLVTDVARTGRWSPECVGADVPPGTHLGPGSVFTGHNERGGNTWSTTCRVRAAIPGLLFRFDAGPGQEATTWTYAFRELGDGRVQVAESFDAPLLRTDGLDAPAEETEQLAARLTQLREDLVTTLENLRTVAEQDPTP